MGIEDEPSASDHTAVVPDGAAADGAPERAEKDNGGSESKTFIGKTEVAGALHCEHSCGAFTYSCTNGEDADQAPSYIQEAVCVEKVVQDQNFWARSPRIACNGVQSIV